MKTIKEWLEELDEPYRTQALENMDVPPELTKSLSEALIRAFIWEDTPQGKEYWREIHEELLDLDK